MATLLYSHTSYSNSGRSLARALNIRRISHAGSRFRGGEEYTVINWGAAGLPPNVVRCNVINLASLVERASNKLSFFRLMIQGQFAGVIPEWTTHRDRAKGWCREDGRVVVRGLLRASGADGLSIVRSHDLVPIAPLYTRYFKKQEEYRVHVAFGEVIDIQRKARKLSVPDADVDWEVRNLAGGFIYARNEGHIPNQLVIDAVQAVHTQTQLDFGAYDVLWNSESQRAVVLEVNTAPGLEGTTLQNYEQAFRRGLNL